jgi:hypothetical protein
MITPAIFRSYFTEFGNTTTYPDSLVSFWIAVAGQMLRVEAWGQPTNPPVSPPTGLYDIGTALFVAHNLALEQMAIKAAANGGTPGINKGPVSSETIGPISAGYDSGAAIVDGGGNWNLTTYGTRFLWFVDMLGAGPVQVGIGYNPYPTGSFPWLGPFPYGGIYPG